MWGTRRDGGLALVYRGPASTPGCPEAVAEVLRASPRRLDVRYVGPAEPLPLTAQTLSGALLYAQPGGGSLGRAYKKVRREAPAIRDFVASGGHYLGFCLGAYLAGETPGFGLLPGDTDQYISSPGAGLTNDRDAVIEVTWRGVRRRLYAQDPPYLALDPSRGPAQVLAVYDNGLPAGVVAPFGRGRVGVVGPHPEATPDWFLDVGLRVPRPLGLDLAADLLEAVLTGAR